MRKIKKILPAEDGRVHKKRQLSEDYLKFSFKYLHFSPKFNIHRAGNEYLKTFLDRLISYSGISVQDFKSNKSKSLRVYRLDWEQTSEKEGFTHLNQQLRDCEAWQFGLSVNQHGRVHGILIDEIL